MQLILVNFNDYRDKWIYVCPACGLEIIAFRDCGEQSPCACNSVMVLKEKIKGKHVKYESKDGCANVHIFKPYFDCGIGGEITSAKEIKDICKRKGYVYAGDKELSQEAKRISDFKKSEYERKWKKLMKDI